MKSVSGKELARILERHGWLLLRVNGSHHIYVRPGALFDCLCLFMVTNPSK
jgi:predicted RNA binding protein YcfA (HicA-like mRNA interferase family)